MAEKKDEKVEGFMAGFKKLLTETFGAKQNFKEAKLKDGTVIYYEGDMPVEGLEVWVIPTDGTDKLPAPDGVHTLEDGTQLEVVAGKITKVVAAAPMSTEAPTDTPTVVPATEAAAKRIVESTIKETVFTKEEVDAKINAVTDAFNEKFEAHKKETETTISTLTKANENLTKEVATSKAETEKFRNQLNTFVADTTKLIGEYGAQPEKAVEKKPAEFNKEKKPVETIDEWREKWVKK